MSIVIIVPDRRLLLGAIHATFISQLASQRIMSSVQFSTTAEDQKSVCSDIEKLLADIKDDLLLSMFSLHFSATKYDARKINCAQCRRKWVGL